MENVNADLGWSLEREIVLSRVFDAPRELVFKAWTDQRHLDKWFGPSGFSIVTHECDVRVGGRWRFDMVSPDKNYGNRMVFLQIRAPELLVFDHGADRDDDPDKFRVTITFDEQTNRKTVVTLRQLHPSKALRDAKIAFGAVEYGNQTMGKLADYLREL